MSTRGYRRAVSARGRVTLLVAAVCAVAVAVVAAAVLSADGDSAGAPSTTSEPKLREGRPPLSLALGFRTDPEAQDLTRGVSLYRRGDVPSAARLFAKHDSLEAKAAAALAAWPEGSLDRLEQLAKLYPEAAVVQLHLGLVRLWANQGDPVEAWRAVLDAEPDTPYAIVAGNLLHPGLPRGLPTFIPSFSPPQAITRLPPAHQLEALRLAAKRGGLREQLLYGIGLQRVGRPVSAARVFDEAARRFPNDVEAQVADAVGRFDKDAPEKAFGRLGPLSRTHGGEPTVRFHLGVLLLWTGRIKPAERQFRLASRADPSSPLGREAARYLETIRKARS
jgi:tetratricopeptide (TPR) repeat protein